MRAAAAAATLLCAAGARADVFSPGPLARAHQGLEGLQNCTRCHVKGGQLSEAHCLDCHKEIDRRIGEKKGLHGRLPPAERACNTCHHEHQGRAFALVDWGAAKEEGFDHERTGFALAGKHARTACAKCHAEALIEDPAVKAHLARSPEAKTFLGLPKGCADCHFDEHRDQLGASCKDCHDEKSWKPAAGFKHSRSEYPLEGKHARVKCVKCHAPAHDVETHAAAPLPPVSTAFARYRPLPHASCADCHDDPHQNRFGAACASCHEVAGWKDLRGVGGARAFHERSRYPLRGAHLEVACKKCHGPFPGVRAKFKDLRFASCTDCHVDAHLGQLGSPPAACDGCHTVQSFAPATYDPALHRRYPLQGGHAAVACSLCHRQEPASPAKAASIRKFLESRARADRISLARFRVEAKRCDACHADPHARQFAARVKQHGCADCHQTRSFQEVRFDHQRESTYALTGGHRKATCAGCHLRDASGAVRYKPVASACASCHADPHAGQFAPGRSARDCAGCHGTAAWKTLSFVHAAPFTPFQLEGKHAKAECGGCHREIGVGNGARVRHYRGVPTDCAGCHVDVHRGAFKGSGGRRCEACHSAAGWRPVSFDHSRSGFPLEGRHLSASCRSCHTSEDYRAPVPRTCAACHKDAHTGELGGRCSSCHDARDWTSRFGPDAHRQTNFPLSGRHAAIPCEECHLDQRDRKFTRATLDCVACHQADLARTAGTALDHSRAGFGTDCKSCHFPSRFKGARFAAHETCFQISGGPHAGISCLDCHTSLASTASTGQCATNTADCMRCHACARVTPEHGQVAGFQCRDRKCYECHQFTPSGGALRGPSLRGAR